MSSTTNGPLAPPGSLLDHTLRTAPLKVVYSTLTFTALGGVVGAATGVARGIEAIPASFKTSLNTGIFSFTFFSIREYGLIPLFTHFDLLPSPLSLPSPSSSSTTSTPPSPHFHNFLPTITSGIITGTLFSYFQRPSSSSSSPSLPSRSTSSILVSSTRHLKGGFTLGLGTLLVQSLVNEFDLLRIKWLQRSEERQLRLDLQRGDNSTIPTTTRTRTSSHDDEEEEEQRNRKRLLPIAIQSDSPRMPDNRRSILSPLPNVAPSNSQHFSDPTTLTFSERSDLLFQNGWARFKTTLESWAPLKKIERGEFESRVEKEMEVKRSELNQVQRELRELEMEVERRSQRQSGH